MIKVWGITGGRRGNDVLVEGIANALGGDLRLVSDSFDNASNLTPLDGYALAGLRAALPFGERFELFGRVENLFDTEYQTAAGYATAGRSAYVGARAVLIRRKV